MTSSHASPIIIEDDTDRASLARSAATTTTPLVNPFATIMAPEASREKRVLRDYCFRPKPTYNDYYDLNKTPNMKNHEDYSPYDYREPLFNDRKVLVPRLLAGIVVAGAIKRKLRYNVERYIQEVHMLDIICDNVKHWKATSKRLKRYFSIANIDAVKAIPDSYTTVPE
ncbi:hypothetical protein ACEPPN_000606 [Leptodophora sp. 'Broadleaf-Isolate-01']